MISIIIPTLREENGIERTLVALRKETEVPIEIIVTDGGSKDHTAEIARKYADIVLVHDKPYRQTIAEGRNEGAKVAHGEYLFFMDADCTLDNQPDFFRRVLKNFQDRPKLVALAAPVGIRSDEATKTDRLVEFFVHGGYAICNNILHIGAAPGECVIVKREAFDKVGGFRKDLVAAEDINFFYRLSKIGQTRYDMYMALEHSGRHVHTVGWPKLLSQWFMNTVSLIFRNKSASKEWTPVREEEKAPVNKI